MSRADSWDMVIVGAGFAGLAAAQSAARSGMRVLVLERRRDLAEGVHTTGLLCPATVEQLRPPSGVIGGRLDALELWSADGALPARVRRVGSGFTPTLTGQLLAELAERARGAGAEVRLGERVDHVEERSGFVRVRSTSGTSTADQVIGADGARSAVARSLGLARPPRMLIGVERHVEVRQLSSSALDREACTLLLHREWAPGYACWAFEGVGGIWQLGVLGIERPGYRPARALDAFTAWLRDRRGFLVGSLVETRGGIVPVSTVRGPSRASRVTILGDAAGHVSALTAGGIGRASSVGVETGSLLARGRPAGEALGEAARSSGRHRVLLRRGLEASEWMGDSLRVGLARSLVGGPIVEELAFRWAPPRPTGAPSQAPA